jgi:hypothetical protein
MAKFGTDGRMMRRAPRGQRVRKHANHWELEDGVRLVSCAIALPHELPNGPQQVGTEPFKSAQIQYDLLFCFVNFHTR